LKGVTLVNDCVEKKLPFLGALLGGGLPKVYKKYFLFVKRLNFPNSVVGYPRTEPEY
jgi:hypothetical protein